MGRRTRTIVLGFAFLAALGVGDGVAHAVNRSTTKGPTTRTSTSATSHAIATATTAPAIPTTTPTTWHFEGHHLGIEHLAFHTGGCAVLSHHLQETFTLTNGTAWSFDAHYCGTIDAHNVWTGVGTFSIMAGTSSTLVGTFTDSAHLPSIGIPYELDVTSGTGTFAHATGSCNLDNHLRITSAGVQTQQGIFVCDLRT